MKNFIKKYPKRMITALLVVLLIAVIGTANNYPTYGSVGEPKYHTDELVEFLHEIYGNISEKYNNLFYKETNLETRIWEAKFSDKFFEMKIDRDIYSCNDTITVTVENKMFNDVSFYERDFMLQIAMAFREPYYDGYRYFDVYGGACPVRDKGELISLNEGETCELEIQLGSLDNVNGKPITLIEGYYRLSIPFYVYGNPEYSDKGDSWLICEFKIK